LGHLKNCTKGQYRRVWLNRRFAVKFPRLSNVVSGMRCNRWEREMWRTWRPIFQWSNLCPVVFADPFGCLVIMRRALQPVTIEEIVAADTEDYPDIDVEFGKPANWGRLNGLIVAVDYGSFDESHVRERRQYLTKKANDRRQG
jgi:hypothetical protein